MAVVSEKSPLQGLSGSIEDLTFKQYKNKTVVTRKPARRKKDSALQTLNIHKFAEASRHARAVLRDPVKRDHYRKLAKKLEKHSAYNLIISEYMIGTSIEQKETRNTKRVVLSIAKKAVKIRSVAIKVLSQTKEIIATGAANPINATQWSYNLPDAKAHALSVTITDVLGQVVSQKIVLRKY